MEEVNVGQSLAQIRQEVLNGKLTFHSAGDGRLTDVTPDLSMLEAYQVAHAAAASIQFRGAFLGLRVDDRMPCLVLLEGAEMQIFTDEGDPDKQIKDLHHFVKLFVTDKDRCGRCQTPGGGFRDRYLPK